MGAVACSPKIFLKPSSAAPEYVFISGACRGCQLNNIRSMSEKVFFIGLSEFVDFITYSALKALTS